MWAQFALIQLSYAINTEYGEKQNRRYFYKIKKFGTEIQAIL